MPVMSEASAWAAILPAPLCPLLAPLWDSGSQLLVGLVAPVHLAHAEGCHLLGPVGGWPWQIWLV